MSDAMKEFFGDLPGRPDHVDFWKLSEVVLGLDAAAEHPDALKRETDGLIDLPSLVYTAKQRALRVGVNPDLRPILAAIWMDGFMAGVRYGRREAT